MAENDVRSGLSEFRREVARVVAAVKQGAFALTVAEGCRRIAEESTRRDRPLAWNDVTGNLRASITFQVEGYIGADPFPALDGSGHVYNSAPYLSGKASDRGDYGVVFAPPEYAIHVEAKSSRSVLLEPIATARRATHLAMAAAGRRAWSDIVANRRPTEEEEAA
jgi:hypothetical protein